MQAQGGLWLRIGVHLGDITVQAEDIFGGGVNIAARLQALAAPGEVLISDTVRDCLDQRAAASFDGGKPRTLKNIARPVVI